MIAAQDIGVDGGAFDVVFPYAGDEEVVDSPSHVSFSGFGKVAPPGVGVFFIGMEVTEGVGEAGGKEVCHTASFFIGEAGIFMVGGGVGDIDVFVGHVQVAAENHRLFGGQFCHVFFHSFFPGHAVGKARQSPLAVGSIAAEKVVASEVGGNEPSFLVMFFDAQAVGHGEGFFFGEDGGTAVSFLYGAVPVLVISWQVQLDLVGLQFGFLQAEAVCIKGIESVHKAFFYAGPKSVYVPGNIFQCFHRSLLI